MKKTLCCILVLIMGSASSQPTTTSVHGCKKTLSQQVLQNMKLEKVRDMEHLIQQVYQNLSKGLLCADPQLLEEQWGIRIDGTWRKERGIEPLPLIWKEGKAFYPGTLAKYTVAYEPAIGQLFIAFAPGQATIGKSLIPIEDIFAIFGQPHVEVNRLYPSPTPGTYVPPKTGPFPGGILRWTNNSASQVTIEAIASNDSQIHSLTFQMR